MKYTAKSSKTQIQGFDTVLSNLNREIAKIRSKSVIGLIEAAVLIHREMETTSPLIPVDKGNLRHSWFVQASNGKLETNPQFSGEDSEKMQAEHTETIAEAKSMLTNKLGLVMGFSANYAAPVHEMIGDVNWSRPGSGAKFFETHIFKNKDTIVKLVQKNASV